MRAASVAAAAAAAAAAGRPWSLEAVQQAPASTIYTGHQYWRVSEYDTKRQETH